MSKDQLHADLVAALRPFGEAAIRLEDADAIRLIRQVINGSGQVMVERLSGPLPPNLHGVVQDESVQVSFPSFSTVTNLEDLLALIIAGLSAVGSITVEEADGSPSGSVTTLVFPNGSVAIDTDTGTATISLSGIFQPLDADLTAIAGLGDPGADRILFWDDSAGSFAYLTAGTGLSIAGTTIDASGGGGGLTQEQIEDFIAGTFLVAGNNVDLTYNDGAGTLTIDVETLTQADITSLVSDLAAKAPLASPTFTGTVTLPVGLTGVLRADTGVVSVDTDVTDIVAAASDTAAGKVELATTAETTTGTDATRAVTPDGLHDMTSLAGAAWFLDEDNMATNSDTKTASQQSIKAYVDAGVAGAGTGVFQPLDADLTTIAGLGDPNADRMLFWDDSAGAYAYLATGTGLAITGTTIAATGAYTDTDVTTFMQTRRISSALKSPGTGTAFIAIGWPAPSLNGTVGAADGNDGPWTNMATSTTLNNAAGALDATASYNNLRWSWGPVDTVFIVKTDASAITTLRYWVGWASASVDASASPAVHLAAFRYDTAADGTAFWRAVTNDGGVTPTVTTTTQSIAADTMYEMRIVFDVAQIFFYINGTLVATHNTDLPTTTTPLGFVARVVNLVGGGGSARAIRLSRFGAIGQP